MKSCFFEKIQNIDKLLAKLRKKQDTNCSISNERGDMTTDTTEMKKIDTRGRRKRDNKELL